MARGKSAAKDTRKNSKGAPPAPVEATPTPPEAPLAKRRPARVRPDIASLPAYVPGARGDGRAMWKISSNENPAHPLPGVLAAIADAAEDVNRYPDMYAVELTEAIARRLGVGPERVVCANGSVSALAHVMSAACLSGDEVVYPWRSFEAYPITVQVSGATSVRVPLTAEARHDLPAMAAAITPKTKVIFIANPHNPTGTIVRKPELEEFLNRVPYHALVVMDEAYCEFVDDPGYPTSLDYVAEGRNVVVLRTFSKIYALAGLRVGYGVFPDHLAPAVKRVRPPFNVSTVAQAAAVASLRDGQQVARSKAYNTEARRYLCGEFDRLGLAYAPSQANFILVDLGVDCVEAFQRLLRRGYIVRTGDVFNLPTHVRVSFGTPEQNAGFIAALEQVLAELC